MRMSQPNMPGGPSKAGPDERHEARIYDSPYDQTTTDDARQASTVRTYERPDSADRPRMSVAMLIVLIAVLALLAFAALQLLR
jgi:hypothetical protein